MVKVRVLWPIIRLAAQSKSSSGAYNRVFLLTMDTGAEVIAKLPFPNSGPPRLTTASEVATMDYLRSRFGFPIPKVFTWDASSDNPVGWEYIVMEKIPGSIFALHSDEIAQSPTIVSPLAKLQYDISSVFFSQFGSLYYKEDVDETLQARPLYAPGVPEDEHSNRFRIGPTVDVHFYRGGRAGLNIKRGPCASLAYSSHHSLIDA